MAYRRVMSEAPRTHARAAAMARELVEIQIAAGPPSPSGPTVAGPVQLLALSPGALPRSLAT